MKKIWKAAGEEAEHQQHVAGVPECFGERLHHRLPRRAGLRRRHAAVAWRGERERQRQDEKHDGGKNEQRILPAESIDEAPPRGGRTENCPNEPAAVPTPKAIDRHSGGISFPNAPITMVKEAPASPKPMIRPAVRWSIAGVSA